MTVLDKGLKRQNSAKNAANNACGVSQCETCLCMTHTLVRGDWRLCGKCQHHKTREEAVKKATVVKEESDGGFCLATFYSRRFGRFECIRPKGHAGLHEDDFRWSDNERGDKE